MDQRQPRDLPANPGRGAWDRPDLLIPVAILIGAWIGSRLHLDIPLGEPIRAHQSFFEAVAQVFPVLLVALFVEVAADLGSLQASIKEVQGEIDNALNESDDRAANRHLVDRLKLAGHRLEVRRFRLGMAVLWPVVLGEGAALIALADRPTVFLTGVCVVSLGFAGIALVLTFGRRMVPGRSDPFEPR